jgi:hypothetical protein
VIKYIIACNFCDATFAGDPITSAVTGSRLSADLRRRASESGWVSRRRAGASGSGQFYDCCPSPSCRLLASSPSGPAVKFGRACR